MSSCYPVTRKITGKLDKGILVTLHTELLLAFLHKKHSICGAKLDGMSLNGLHHYMKNQKQIQRASTAKLIHGRIPTNYYLHNRGELIATYVLDVSYTSDHILECDNSDALDAHKNSLYSELQKLVTSNISIIIISILECKLTHLQKYVLLTNFIHPKTPTLWIPWLLKSLRVKT